VETPGMRRRLLICSFLGLSTQWSGNGLISYFLARILEGIGIHDNKTKNMINFGLSVWSLTNGTFFAFFVHRFRRRTAFLACTISLFVVFTAFTIASAEYNSTKNIWWGQIALFLIFLYSPAYNMAYNVLQYAFLVELFPFATRARGIALFQWWGRVAGFFNQFINPIGISYAGWKYYIMYCVYILFEVVFIYFIFPETSNRTLEELAFLFEDDQLRKEQESRVEEELLAEEVEALVSGGSGTIYGDDGFSATPQKRSVAGDSPSRR